MYLKLNEYSQADHRPLFQTLHKGQTSLLLIAYCLILSQKSHRDFWIFLCYSLFECFYTIVGVVVVVQAVGGNSFPHKKSVKIWIETIQLKWEDV